MNLPPFTTQTWIKMKEQTIQAFHNSVNEHIKDLTEKGYNVEVEWLNSKGEVCDDENDIAVSVECRIVKRPEKTKDIGNENSKDANSAWIAEQRRIVEKMFGREDER